MVIEEDRETREKLYQRKLTIRGALELAEAIRRVDPDNIFKKISQVQAIEPVKSNLRELSLHANLMVDDPDCIDLIKELHTMSQIIPSALKEKATIVRHKLIELQGKLGKFTMEWHQDLTNVTVPPPKTGYGTGYGQNYGKQL